MFTLRCLFLLPFIVCISSEGDLHISISDGHVQGFYKTSYNDRRYSAFEGIPYAAPPTGDKRFTDPQPVVKWNRTLIANVTYTCIQLDDLSIIGVVILTQIFAQDSITVNLKDGKVRGHHKTSYDGRFYLAFEGIPYAKPPLNKLRFQSPQPAVPWSGTLVANKTYICIQSNGKQVIGNENCLYLYVYVPREQIYPDEKLPVLVHFHGGAFMTGSPQMFSGPSKLMDREVVYVSINYRLGPLGFLSTEDEIIPGNYGLKDQNLALKWIQANIDQFGGDKESVTLMGMSAGGASAHLHFFSPASKGLFHRGIIQSGTALDPWALKRDPKFLTNKLLEQVECNFESSADTLQCLQSQPVEAIVEPVKLLYDAHYLPLTPFGPVIEPPTAEAFLTMDPHSLLLAREYNEVPLLISVTSDEGILPTVFFIKDLENLNENWHIYAPLMLDYYELDEDEKFKITGRINDVFLENKEFTRKNYHNLVTLATKRMFDLGAEQSALLHSMGSLKSNVYLFKMAYAGEEMSWDYLMNQTLHLGVGHGEDSRFYYDVVYHEEILTEDEKTLKDSLLNMVVKFAKYGVAKLPNVQWKPVSSEEPIEYLVVRGPEDFEMQKSTNERYKQFWDDVNKLTQRLTAIKDEL